MKSAVLAGVLAANATAIKNKLKVQEQLCQEPFDCLAQTADATSLEATARPANGDMYNYTYGDFYDAEKNTYYDCCHDQQYNHGNTMCRWWYHKTNYEDEWYGWIFGHYASPNMMKGFQIDNTDNHSTLFQPYYGKRIEANGDVISLAGNDGSNDEFIYRAID